MFLNSTPLQYTPRAFYTIDKSLIDNDVNYYDFQKSKEYQDVYNNVLSSEIQTMDVYDSPYFGLGSGAYRALDRAYEAYKSQIAAGRAAKDTVFEVCPPGSRMVDGVCVGDPSTYGPTTTSTVNPVLILAAAAAAFFIGG